MKALILAGGAGTRLWPLSTEDRPKQFVPLIDGKTLFELAVERAKRYADEVFVVTLEKYSDYVETLAPSGVTTIFEPARMGTMAAITYSFGVMKSLGVDEDEPVLILPSDHYVRVDEDFDRAIAKAAEYSEDWLILIGIPAKYPSTRYGYIAPGEHVGDEVYRVASFKEKPVQEVAERFYENGYYWNSGMFVFRRRVFEEEMKKHASDYLRVYGSAEGYSSVPDLSVDYALLEASERSAFVKFIGVWSDLGSYYSLYEFFPKDDNRNVVIGSADVEETCDSLIINMHSSPLVVSGLKGHVVVKANGKTYVGLLYDDSVPKKYAGKYI